MLSREMLRSLLFGREKRASEIESVESEKEIIEVDKIKVIELIYCPTYELWRVKYGIGVVPPKIYRFAKYIAFETTERLYPPVKIEVAVIDGKGSVRYTVHPEHTLAIQYVKEIGEVEEKPVYEAIYIRIYRK
jgi:hypothetical protein